MDSKNVWKGLAFGGFASCVAEVCTLPIDVVKVSSASQANPAHAVTLVAVHARLRALLRAPRDRCR